jgi:hypothetical protein
MMIGAMTRQTGSLPANRVGTETTDARRLARRALTDARTWRCAVRSAVIGTAAAFTALATGSARAETRLTAHYAISVAGVSVGEGTWTVDIDASRYAARADGSFTGVWRLLAGGDVFSATRGTVGRGHLAPAHYEANFGLDAAIEGVRMDLRDDTVTDLDVRPALPDLPDRVAVTDAHRRGVVDPLTAGLMPVPGTGSMLTPASCQRTLPMFDGGHRFDIALSFKRMDAVTVAHGYRGPAVVCAMTYQPISGHSPTAWRVTHLMGRRGMEMWLAPIDGSRLLAPFRISVPTLLGLAVVEATRFESTTPP